LLQNICNRRLPHILGEKFQRCRCFFGKFAHRLI
jgi:hypothetical protein